MNKHACTKDRSGGPGNYGKEFGVWYGDDSSDDMTDSSGFVEIEKVHIVYTSDDAYTSSSPFPKYPGIISHP